MNPKLLRSTLSLFLTSIVVIGCTRPDRISSASDAKAKFANDYNAGRWRDAIADADMLREAGVLDAQAQLVVGMAYFKSGDYVGCVKHAETINSDDARELQARCAFEVAKAQ